MTKDLLKQFPFCKQPYTLLYHGRSMNPTMKDLDVVQFKPYFDEPPHIGDIIIIQRREEPFQIIIHRIVAITLDGIRTQGDNCTTFDPWVLHPSDILGYVTSVKRGNQIININSGPAGYLIIFMVRIIKHACNISRTWAAYIYHKMISFKFPAQLLSPFLKCRIVTFNGTNRSEYQLFLGPICIGRLHNGSTVWEVKAPYRLLINPILLQSVSRKQDIGSSQDSDKIKI